MCMKVPDIKQGLSLKTLIDIVAEFQYLFIMSESFIQFSLRRLYLSEIIQNHGQGIDIPLFFIYFQCLFQELGALKVITHYLKNAGDCNVGQDALWLQVKRIFNGQRADEKIH